MTDLLEFPAAADRFTIGRPAPPDRIVHHTSTTTWSNTIATFQGGPRIVSAHFVVDQFVDRIARCVNEPDTAWHCGNWAFNQRSIGIEYVDNANWNGIRPPEQYERGAFLTYLLCFAYAIPITRTTNRRHNEIIATECPDTLDVDRIVRRAKEYEMTFDPRNVQADKDFLDQRIREIVMGEPNLTAYALKHYLATPGPLGVVGGSVRRVHELDIGAINVPKVNKGDGRRKAPTKADVQKGHGRG